MKGALVSAAGSLGLVQLTEWIHEVAGPAGDLAVILAASSALFVVARKVAAKTRKAWDTIELVAEQTQTVPEIATKLDRHILETTEAFAMGTEKFARIEAALEVLAAEDAAEISARLRRAG